jgi:hypothetical protein
MASMTQSDGQMAFAGPGLTCQNDVFPIGQPTTRLQAHHRIAREVRLEGKVKPLQALLLSNSGVLSWRPEGEVQPWASVFPYNGSLCSVASASAYGGGAACGRGDWFRANLDTSHDGKKEARLAKCSGKADDISVQNVHTGEP